MGEELMRETAESSRAGYWQKFENTGRVEDYLRYSWGWGTQEAMAGSGKSGADPHAGFYHSDRNDTETDAYR